MFDFSKEQSVVKFYNSVHKTRYKTNNQFNLSICKEVLEENSLDSLTDFISRWDEERGNFVDCLKTFSGRPFTNTSPINYNSNTNISQTSELDGALSIIRSVVTEYTKNILDGNELHQTILNSIKSDFEEYIEENYGVIERKIKVTVDENPSVTLDDILHEKFETILSFVQNDEPVFLTGPAGTGKNVICKQIAKVLGLDFYFSNAVSQEYKITGFTDANGVYQESQFYKAFKNGGLFMLDEMDASVPEVLVILNAAIANRYFDFPAPIGYVEAHPNFRVVSAGNTFGLGADYEYVGRNQLDMASLDRFAFVPINYDKNIELRVAKGDKNLVEFCEEFRKACEKSSISVIVSYRSIGRIAKMKDVLGTEECLKTCLLKSLAKDDINMLRNSIRYLENNPYYDAFIAGA